MDRNKDNYAILGVLPTAEKAVIKAAYRALAQLYHPDVYEGSEEDANSRMQELNEAYSVLSKPDKRSEYDKMRGNSTQDAEDAFQDDYEPSSESDPLEEKWKTAEQYYPDLHKILEELNVIAWRLGYAYKAYLLETKEFKKRHELAEIMENEFLKTYYGNNDQILRYAKRLIKSGNREAALELNRASKLFGDDIDANLIIDKIERGFDPFGNFKASRARKKDEDNEFSDFPRTAFSDTETTEASEDKEFSDFLRTASSDTETTETREDKEFSDFLRAALSTRN